VAATNPGRASYPKTLTDTGLDDLTEVGRHRAGGERDLSPPPPARQPLSPKWKVVSPHERDPYPIIALRRWQSLLFQRFQVLLTLYSEFFASFPYGTCMLSGSHRVFSLGWSIPPGFRLHSQAARLCDSVPLWVLECWLIPLSESAPTGISPSLLPPFQVTWGHRDCTGPRARREATIPEDRV